MRGSTPLDVAASSVMDNNGLALALEEPDLDKVGDTVSIGCVCVGVCIRIGVLGPCVSEYPQSMWLLLSLSLFCHGCVLVLQVVTYLAGCGLQSCPMLLDKGYPDIGWNPIEGERYLSFLRFAVFVNGRWGTVL